jgi:hypothetical protein
MKLRMGEGTVIRVRRTAPRALGNLAVATGRERMTASVVLDDSISWALVVMAVIASLAAAVASVAAWRASKACRLAIGQLATARREAVAPEREWQERSPVPRRATDAATGFRAWSEPTPPAPLAPVAPPVTAPPATASSEPPRPASRPRAAATPAAPAPARRSDMLDDPDHPGTLGSARHRPPAPPAAPPEALRTEPLERPRPKPPLGPADEREVHPGVFVTIPGRPAAPPAAATPPPAPTQPETRRETRAEPAAPASETPPADARLERLSDPDPFVRIEAIEQLRGHPARVEVLVRLLYDEFPVVRRQAVRSLRRAGGPVATKALLEVASQDPSAEVRQEAVDALGAMLRDVRSNPA